MSNVDFEKLDPISSTLSPLPSDLRSGLTAVAVLATISLATTTALFFNLTFKLVKWYILRYRTRRNAATQQGVDLSLGLAQQHIGNSSRRGRTEAELAADIENAAQEAAAVAAAIERKVGKEPNQFVVLLYNLLLADIHQSMAFFLNALWVRNDAIEVGTTSCFAQGFFVSTGDLSASLFITAIACHTYIVIVLKRKPPQWAIIATCVGLWMFNYAMVFVGLGVTDIGAQFGGFYVRAAAWCWMNVKYDLLRLVTHYLFIFISITLTSLLYILIFLHLRRTNTTLTTHQSEPPPPSSLDAKTNAARISTHTVPSHPHTSTAGHNPAFLIYPVIYVVCTLPLALCRVATMAGVQVPLSLFCVAGALITSNGLLDTVLWATTRRSVVFGAVDEEDVGIETFAFMRTPHERKFGNMIWVQAGPAEESSMSRGGRHGGNGSLSALDRVLKGPEGWRELTGGKGKGGMMGGQRSTSQESLRRGAAGGGEPSGGMSGGIQLDLVTTVVVEVDHQAAAARRSMSSRRRGDDGYSGRPSYEKEALPVLKDHGGLLS